MDTITYQEDKITTEDMKRRLIRHLRLDSGMQNLLNEAADILGNPICLYDLGNRLLCASKGEIKNEEKYAAAKEKYMFSTPHSYYELYNMYRKDRLVESFNLCGRPSFSPDDSEPRYIASKILINNQPVATLDIYEVNQPLQVTDLDIAEILSKFIALEMEQTQAFDVLGMNSHAKMFRHILADPTYPTSTRDFREVRAFERSHPAGKTIAAINIAKPERSNNNLLYLCYLLQTELEHCTAFLLSDAYICILFDSGYEPVIGSDTAQKLIQFLESNYGYCGVGPVFRDLSSFPETWSQAKSAIYLGQATQSKRRIFYYDDLLPQRIIAVCDAKHELRSFCDPALLQIIDHDNACGTHYTDLLQTYLNSDCNKSQAARKLGISRASFISAFHTIGEQFSLELHSNETLFRLRFSFMIIEYIKYQRTHRNDD